MPPKVVKRKKTQSKKQQTQSQKQTVVVNVVGKVARKKRPSKKRSGSAAQTQGGFSATQQVAPLQTPIIYSGTPTISSYQPPPRIGNYSSDYADVMQAIQRLYLQNSNETVAAIGGPPPAAPRPPIVELPRTATAPSMGREGTPAPSYYREGTPAPPPSSVGGAPVRPPELMKKIKEKIHSIAKDVAGMKKKTTYYQHFNDITAVNTGKITPFQNRIRSEPMLRDGNGDVLMEVKVYLNFFGIQV